MKYKELLPHIYGLIGVTLISVGVWRWNETVGMIFAGCVFGFVALIQAVDVPKNDRRM